MPTTAPKTEKGYQHHESWWSGMAEEAPELTWPNSITVYNRMRREDPQISSILKAAMLPIRRTRWWVDPVGASDEVTAFVAENLGLPIKGEEAPRLARSVDRFSWDDHLRLALLELVFGHSFFEQVYRVDDKGRARLRRLGWRPPMTIAEVKVAEDGGLESITQFGALAGNRDSTIPVSQLVAYVNEREGGNWLGQSVLRPAYKFWLLKDMLLKIQAQTIERNGMGVPIYTGPDFSKLLDLGPDERKDAEDEELARGEDLATAYRAGGNAGAAIPHGADFKLLGVTGSLPDIQPVLRYYDEQIAAAVLANFLKLGGADSTGSYALGATFADFFVMSLQSEALHIADVTNAHVVADLVDINFGSDVAAPRVGFEEIGTQQHATAAGIAQLVGAGAMLPEPNLEAHLRDMYGIPAKAPAPSKPATAPQETP